MQKIKRTDNEWYALIQACRNSGLSDKDWCEQQNISTNSFYSAIKRLRRKACDLPKPSARQIRETHEIIPVSIGSHSDVSSTDFDWAPDLSPKTENPSAITLTVKGCVMEIQNTAGRDLVFNTIAALQQLC